MILTFSNQKFEKVVKTLPKQALEVGTRGGLYSTLGRVDVGLTEADIDDLTATVTGRAEVLASIKRAAFAQSIVRNDGGTLSSLLGTKTEEPLPTINPPCLHDTSDATQIRQTPAQGYSTRKNTTRVLNPGRLLSRTSLMQVPGREEQQGLRAIECSDSLTPVTWRGAQSDGVAVLNEVGLNDSGRVKVIGANEGEHRKQMSTSLRRMRQLLNDSLECAGSGTKRPRSAFPLSVSELRSLASARRSRDNNRGGKVGDVTEKILPNTGGMYKFKTYRRLLRVKPLSHLAHKTVTSTALEMRFRNPIKPTKGWGLSTPQSDFRLYTLGPSKHLPIPGASAAEWRRDTNWTCLLEEAAYCGTWRRIFCYPWRVEYGRICWV